MGKGDRPRPIRDRERYDRNWERIFGDECQDTSTNNENCNGYATPDTDINPAEREDKDG